MRAAVSLAFAGLLAAGGAAQAATHTVTIEAMRFQPAALAVQRGDTIVWRNKDMVPHTATAAGRFDSRNIAPGRSWSWTADKAGRVDYGCTYHPGMKAAVDIR